MSNATTIHKNSLIKRTPGEKVFDVVNAIGLGLLCLLTIYPVLYVFFASLSNGNLLVAHTGLLLWPLEPNLDAFKLVLRNQQIITGFKNTIIVVIVGTVLNLIFTSIGAYFMAQKNVLWKTPITFLFAFTMFFSGGMVPFYLVVNNLKLNETLWAVILPFLVSTSNMIIMRTNFQTIPDSLFESARLDGACHLTILFRIVVPLSKTVIAVMLLFYGVDKWNGWFWASVFLLKPENKTIQLVLREILMANDITSMSAGAGADNFLAISESIRYATIVVATLPVLLVYPFIQKYFVDGVMIGAIKG